MIEGGPVTCRVSVLCGQMVHMAWYPRHNADVQLPHAGWRCILVQVH
jgi:hypothetical protein